MRAITFEPIGMEMVRESVPLRVTFALRNDAIASDIATATASMQEAVAYWQKLGKEIERSVEIYFRVLSGERG